MLETKEVLLRFEDNDDSLYIITLSHLLQVERLKSGENFFIWWQPGPDIRLAQVRNTQCHLVS
ncbi:hypothetical protein Ddye_023681 [Dipteronia dyeriana]|uniref:Uncharacterized protein n=1 Tax=Dipteronia dyeriana TaxID=168575 RepID=A0AAD9TUE9_9ROSI|nr:hypothetical protein Ddye_023681 [Dipteronia dyeriana]